MKIIVLFNLKPDADPDAYEAWARSRDIPTVRGLASVAGFEVFAATGLLMGEGTPPYQYCEIISVADPDQFGNDVATEAMQRISTEFRDFAEDPVFVRLRDIEVSA